MLADAACTPWSCRAGLVDNILVLMGSAILSRTPQRTIPKTWVQITSRKFLLNNCMTGNEDKPASQSRSRPRTSSCRSVCVRDKSMMHVCVDLWNGLDYLLQKLQSQNNFSFQESHNQPARYRSFECLWLITKVNSQAMSVSTKSFSAHHSNVLIWIGIWKPRACRRSRGASGGS